MSILSRFGDIISANVNALLDKCEDPSKMVDQYLRQAKEDFAECKKDTAQVIAQEKEAKRVLDDAQDKVDQLVAAAKNAVTAGADDDARALLTKKATAEQTRDTALNNYKVAHANAEKMKQLYNKLAADISTLEARRDNVKTTTAVAKTQESINKMTKGMAAGSRAAEGFSRMEAAAQARLDAAEAVAELDAAGEDPESDALLAKYAGGGTDVEAELAKMKAELGKQ